METGLNRSEFCKQKTPALCPGNPDRRPRRQKRSIGTNVDYQREPRFESTGRR
jgi:hypothetical protein